MPKTMFLAYAIEATFYFDGEGEHHTLVSSFDFERKQIEFENSISAAKIYDGIFADEDLETDLNRAKEWHPDITFIVRELTIK